VATLKSQLEGLVALSPDSPEIEFEGRWHTWGQLASGIRQLGALLDAAGLGADARVGVVMRNRPEMVASIMGLMAAERCLVTLNPLFPDDRLVGDIVNTEAPAIVATRRDWERPGLEDAARKNGALCIEAEIEEGGALRFTKRVEADPSRWKRPKAEGIAIEMLTSGTTGVPKRIPLPRRNFEAGMVGYSQYEKGREDGVPKLRGGTQIWHNSFAHISGIGGVLNIILAGRKFALLERFTVPAFHDVVKRHKPKVVNGPPAVVRMLLDAKLPREDFASVVSFRCGSAPLDPAVADEFYDYYGFPCLVNYGATEFAGGASGWTMEDFKVFGKTKRGSVGRLNQGFQGRTVNPETGAPLPAGEAGLLELKAPNLGNGKDWVRTTDLAVVDKDNFLFIKGRADNAIIRGGFKVAPDDVVRALEAHPAIREAAVVGMPDPRLGQVPVAALLLKAGSTYPGDPAMSEFLRKTLTPYQVPVRFAVLDSLPRTGAMKVDLTSLRRTLETPS